MLFPVNCETRKLIAVIRDLLFLIAVDCARKKLCAGHIRFISYIINTHFFLVPFLPNWECLLQDTREQQ